MSADNSILVLTSRGADGRPEYRVAHVQNVEMADYHLVADRDEYLRCYFDEKTVVYRHQHKAFAQAKKLYDECGYVEYGIVTVDLGEPFPGTAGVSKSPQKGARKRRKRSASLSQVLRLKRQVRSLIVRIAALEAAAQRR